MFCIDQGEAIPVHAHDFSGLVFMGGPMSVNDDLPWIAPALSLICDAYAQDIPLLGHCLGGQLISKALGGVVSKNLGGEQNKQVIFPLLQAGENANESLGKIQIKEIGWGKVEAAANDSARTWLGEVKSFEAFHWHGETFSLPQGAVPLLSSEYCTHQAYVLGKHLALQCHVEMSAEMIVEWCAIGADEIAAAQHSPAVQSASLMQAQMHAKLPSLHHAANQLYQQWIQGLVR
jgi:GMP synthase-like glutamine amidotransferase